MRAQNSGKAPVAVKPHVTVPRRAEDAAGPVLSRGATLTPGAVAALQRSVGNAAVTHILQRQVHQHGADRGHGLQTAAGEGSTFVQRARGGAQPDVSRMDGDKLLDIIVGRGDRTLAGFTFGPKTRNNGGKNLISRPVEIEVRDGDTTARLAVHLNVMLNTGGPKAEKEGTTTVPVEMKLFHMTARRSAVQQQMTDAGSFREGADESVHVGRSNAHKGWDNRPTNTAQLAQKAGVSREALIKALEDRFPPDNMVDLIERFKRDAGRAVIYALEPPVVHVDWTGDKSCD